MSKERRDRQERRRQEQIRQELENQAKLYRTTRPKPLPAAIRQAIRSRR